MYKINKSITEYFTAVKLALNNLVYNKLRTALSILGIVIGVMVVIIILSAGLGVKQYIFLQIEAFGGNLIDLQVKIPDASKTSLQNASSVGIGAPITTLKIEDIEKIGKLPNIESWYAMSLIQENINVREENESGIIFGVSPGFNKVDNQVAIEQGAFFTDADDRGLAQVIVLGSKIKKDLFGEGKAVDEYVKVKGKSYKVIGVLKERGSTGFFDFDTIAYMPLQTVTRKIQGIDYVSEAVFKVKDEKLMDQTAAEMTFQMRLLHDITNPNKDDFAVISMNEMRETINSIFKIINILLYALTSISLVVGGVGIMNVMYVAVSERTFEIGLRKAVGASSANIRHQFLFEAVVISLVGAFLGVLLSVLMLLAISKFATGFGYDMGVIISFPAILLASFFSVFVGIIFGYYPAKKASMLSPLDAIRK